MGRRELGDLVSHMDVRRPIAHGAVQPRRTHIPRTFALQVAARRRRRAQELGACRRSLARRLQKHLLRTTQSQAG